MRPRKITLLPLVAATYFIVAGGPFGLEDIVAKSGYGGALLILLLTPLLWSFPTALMVSELASALPEEGGYYVWVSRAMGPFWGFQEAWLSLVGSFFDMAIYPTLFVAYLGRLAPELTAGIRGIVIAVALVAVCAAWNLAGARTVGVSSVWMGGLLLSPFLVLTVAALLHRVQAGASAPPLGRSDILGGILVAMWNYMGWDNASTIAGEVERPERTYPLAMLCSTLLVAATYAIPVAAAAASGLGLNVWSSGGWPDVARGIIPGGPGAALAFAVAIAAMLGAAGTMNTLTMAYSRLPAALGAGGYLPRRFARLTPRSGAPWVSILACAAVWALCLGLSFVKLVVLDVLLTGLSILLEFIALVALRVREAGLHRPYRVPGGLFGAVAIGVPPLALLVLTALRSNIEPVGPIDALELGGLSIGLGIVLYFVACWRRNRSIE
jgi:amino acid transporter